MSQMFSREEQRILETLDQSLRRPGVGSVIQAIASRVDQKLKSDPETTLAWAPVPLEAYGGGLPEMIRSSWVFVLRKGTTSGAERHPNSYQRVMSYRGRADFQMYENGAWRSNVLVDDLFALLNERWLSIPISVWHKPIMGAEDWTVVSFHTATQSELIEERGDPQGHAKGCQETYASRSNSGLLGAR
jgi:hypothetical protein